MVKNVKRVQWVLIALAATNLSGFLPLYAAPADDKSDNTDASCGSTIFSTPDADAEPGYTADKTGGGRFRKMIYGEGKDSLPNFHQVRAIPSLSQAQRKELHKIYGDAKAQMGPLMEQLKQMKEQSGGEGQKALGNPQNRGKFQELRAQVMSIRESTWQKVKANLSEQQLQELDAMKHGQMQPATFNPPQMGYGGKRALMNRGAAGEPAAMKAQPENATE